MLTTADRIMIAMLTIAIATGIVLVSVPFALFGFGVLTGMQAVILILAGVAITGVALGFV